MINSLVRFVPHMVVPAALALAAALFAAGCSSMGVAEVSRAAWIQDNIDTPLTTGDLSRRVKDYLLLRGLDGEFQDEPKYVLEKLAHSYQKAHDEATLIALVELCYYHADQGAAKDRMMAHLSAAYYAYVGILSHGSGQRGELYEPRFLFNCRFYDHASAEFLQDLQAAEIPLDKGFDVPIVGGVTVSFFPAVSALPMPIAEYEWMLNCFDYLPEGFTTYSRQAGLGAPLIPIRKMMPGEDFRTTAGEKGGMFPATMCLRCHDLAPDSDERRATLEFVDTTKTEHVDVGGHTVPLELDITTPLAYYLQERPVTIRGIYYLLNPGEMDKLQGLYQLTAYDPDKIPVVFVHGLMSNPRTWAQMYNTILSDPELRRRYQFWIFTYPTGNPIAYSGSLLRKALLEVRRKCDPAGTNPNFDRMVLISHSMGGLLSKQMAMNTDVSLVEKVLGVPIDQLDITPEQRNFLLDIMVFKRVPCVSRIIFCATPHRGAGMAAWTVTHWASALISLPGHFKDDMMRIRQKAMSKIHLGEDDEFTARTGLDTLDPSNQSIQILADIPLESTIKYHSIIGDTSGPGVVDRTDGIVPYESSHLDCVESEIVLLSGHGVHQTPLAAAEAMRILREHLRETDALRQAQKK